MEERKLNEKESLELITQMIQNTQNRMEINCGIPFLIWGYTTVIVSLFIWCILTSTQNNQWQWLWFILPVIGWTITYLLNRKSSYTVKTYVDRIVSYIWIVLGIIGFILPCIGIFFYIPILFIILLIMGIGTILTGLIIKYKTITICGILGSITSVNCLYLEGVDQILVFIPAIIFMMIIPGHTLNHAARKQKKL